MVLTEIAPGVDLEKDILSQMDFKPVVSPNLKTMPAEIFQTKWGQLRTILEAKQKG
jgi:propionate CoA-transferase